eukprot:481910_1
MASLKSVMLKLPVCRKKKPCVQSQSYLAVEPCIECSIYWLFLTKHFKMISSIRNSADLQIMDISKPLQHVLKYPQIYSIVARKKHIFNRICKIYFAKNNCLHPMVNDKLIRCNRNLLEASLFRLIGQKKCMNWFINLNNGKYLKYLILDKYYKEKKQILFAIKNGSLPKFHIYCCWVSTVICIVRNYQQIIESIQNKNNSNQSLKLLKHISNIYYDQLLTTAIESSPMSANYAATYCFEMHCNNRECNISFSKHYYGAERQSVEYSEKLKNYFTKNKKWPTLFDEQLAINKWYKCSNCRMVYYCSKHCQKLDWNKYAHKNICINHTNIN